MAFPNRLDRAHPPFLSHPRPTTADDALTVSRGDPALNTLTPVPQRRWKRAFPWAKACLVWTGQRASPREVLAGRVPQIALIPVVNWHYDPGRWNFTRFRQKIKAPDRGQWGQPEGRGRPCRLTIFNDPRWG